MNNKFRTFLAIYFPIFIGCSIWYFFDKSKAWLAYVLAAITVGAIAWFLIGMLRKK